MLLLGTVGSLLSMGRATIMITAVMVILCLVIRKKIAAVAVIFLFFVFLIVGARIAYETDKANVSLASLQTLR